MQSVFVAHCYSKTSTWCPESAVAVKRSERHITQIAHGNFIGTPQNITEAAKLTGKATFNSLHFHPWILPLILNKSLYSFAMKFTNKYHFWS